MGDNVNKKEQESNVPVARDHDPLSSYSSKIRFDYDEYSSDNHERGKRRYQDILDSMQEEIGTSAESKFGDVCGKIL